MIGEPLRFCSSGRQELHQLSVTGSLQVGCNNSEDFMIMPWDQVKIHSSLLSTVHVTKTISMSDPKSMEF